MNNKFIEHFKSITRKLINEKSDDYDFFNYHLSNILNHLTGNH